MAAREPPEDGRATGPAQGRKLSAEGDFTVEDFEALCEKHGNVCLRCGDRNALLTPDHVIPLSLGGSNRIANIQPLCGKCNSWKNIRVVDYRHGVVPLEATRTARKVSTRA